LQIGCNLLCVCLCLCLCVCYRRGGGTGTFSQQLFPPTSIFFQYMFKFQSITTVVSFEIQNLVKPIVTEKCFVRRDSSARESFICQPIFSRERQKIGQARNLCGERGKKKNEASHQWRAASKNNIQHHAVMILLLPFGCWICVFDCSKKKVERRNANSSDRASNDKLLAHLNTG
jgi:hypothetical protein